MNAGQKEKQWMLVGLGIIFIGGVWVGLSAAGILGGMAGILGYPLGPGLAFGGLLVVGIYFYRWQRIKKLLQGKDVLVKWGDGEDQIIIAPTCAYAYGELYLWGVPGTRLEGVQIKHEDFLGSTCSYLRITIGEASNSRSPITGSRLWRTRELSIRIPEEQKLAAQRILEELELRKK
jgi:hypothetical protein